MLATTGTIIDDQFEILSPIGSGGYGVVYRAKQLQLDRTVALKMLSAGFDDNPDIQQRFEREARALSSLKHRNLVMVYGTGVWQDRPYMNMEFVQGTSLQLILEEEGRLEIKRAIKIVRQILDGLACAHANGIIHRDLKPANVMILQRGADELVKIIDFGLAKILPGASIMAQKVTEAGYAVGSVMYMSPEQCLAHPVDSRSDIYAVGCILHSCLTGTHPYDGAHSTMVMAQHVQAEPKLLAQSLPEGSFSKELQWVLNKALAKAPDERYQTVEAMSSDLLLIATDRSAEISCSHAERPHSMAATEAEEAVKQRSTIHPICAASIGSFITLLAVLAVLVLLHFKPQSDSTSVELCRRADSFWTKDDDKAVELYERALVKARDDKLLPASLAAKAANAIAAHEMEEHPDRAAAFAKLGIEVVRDMQSGVDDSLLGTASLYMLASINLYRPSDALPLCRRLLNEDEKDRGGFANELRRLIAEGHVMMGRPGAAMDALNACTDNATSPFKGTTHYCLGGIAFLRDDYHNAEAEYKQSWQLDRIHYYPVLCALALAEIAQGDWNSAEKTEQSYDEQCQPCYYSQAVQVLLDAHRGYWGAAHKRCAELFQDTEKNPDLFKAVHVDSVMSLYMAEARRAGLPREVNFVAERWHSRLNRLYSNHMHMFKQANPW